MGIPIAESYGGARADFITHAVAVEEISRSCSSAGFTLTEEEIAIVEGK